MKSKTHQLVLTALMIALMIVLQMTGIGLIRLGVINITFYCTVIAIGSMVLGLKSGLIQGFAFGTISLISAIQAPSGLVAPLTSTAMGWPLVALMCYVPRLMVPVTSHCVYTMLRRKNVSLHVSVGAGAAAGSLCNTILYLGIMLVNYSVTVADYPGLLITVGTIALTGGIPEAIVASLVASPVVIALKKIYKQDR
ncbi:MAG: ECF transporter S component [Clostridia bacterium]|nr:ECF transporter S component [Clostridia bacterium]